MPFFRRFLFGTLPMLLLFACNPIHWFTPEVTVTWDPPSKFEDDSPIRAEDELRYEVFIDKDQDKTHKDMEPLTPEPIKGTSFKITQSELELIEYYYVGVRAVLYKNGKPVDPPRKSRIAWSSSKADTDKGKRFGVHIEK